MRLSSTPRGTRLRSNLPITANARIGPLRIDGELGYWFTNHNVPQFWIRGQIVGRDFSERTQAYLEIYDQQDANRIDGAAKQRETTLGAGGRQTLNSKKNTYSGPVAQSIGYPVLQAV
jgi:hypothetical protein